MVATPEMIARAAQLALEADGIEMTKTMSYMVGNATIKSLKVLELGETGFKAGGAIQASYSMGTTAWKTVEDFSRGDKLCTGLCLVATTCEGIAIAASCCKLVPYRWNVYLGAKVTSTAVMRFRNLCSASHGGPC